MVGAAFRREQAGGRQAGARSGRQAVGSSPTQRRREASGRHLKRVWPTSAQQTVAGRQHDPADPGHYMHNPYPTQPPPPLSPVPPPDPRVRRVPRWHRRPSLRGSVLLQPGPPGWHVCGPGRPREGRNCCRGGGGGRGLQASRPLLAGRRVCGAECMFGVGCHHQ